MAGTLHNHNYVRVARTMDTALVGFTGQYVVTHRPSLDRDAST